MKTLLISLAAFWFASGVVPAEENSKIVWAGQPCEITLGEVSARTMQLVIAPLDAQGKPTPISENAAFLKLPIVEKFRARELTGKKEIAVGKMRVAIAAQPLTISIFQADGSLVQELKLDGDQNQNLGFKTKAPVFGLGQGDQQFDRRGNLYEMIHGQRMKLRKTHGSSQPIPFLIGADGWSLFVRSPGGQFDLRGEKGLFLPDPKTAEPLTIYISECDEPVDALTEYYRLTGQPAMPPKWTMGYMQSHRTLLGPDDAVNIAKTFREKKLPVDAVIYLGTGYAPLGWNLGHGSVEYNPLSFPHPVEQIKSLHDLNLKVVLHVNHAPKNLFGLSMSETSDSPDFIGNYWQRHLPRMAEGVDGWWPDDGDDLPVPASLARHTCYYEGCLQVRPNERPWSLHRNAYAGVARYGGWIWSGDVNSDWATLKNHVPVGLNSSLSMTPFWGTDIGGFLQTPELTGELYARWFQFGAFNPLFRSHGRTSHLHLPWGWNTGETGPAENITHKIDPAELHNAQVEPICRQYLELRYRLLPYNYTLMRESVDTGMPAMRALWLHYPKDAEAVKLGDEYLWGRDLLIAPVVEKGATTRHLYLPAGDWYDWWTGEKNAGGKWVNRAVDLATMPIYVRAGAILPLDPVRQYTAQPVNEPTTMRVYPGADGAFTLYDDVGFSDLGCYGGEIATPNLDALAAGGLRLTQFYNSARCSPSRAAILSGLNPHQAGFPNLGGHLVDNCVLIPEVLKSAGYRTTMVGKWHLGDPPTNHGFEEFYGMLGGYNSCWQEDPFYTRWPKGHEKRVYAPGHFYSTDAFADYSIDFIGDGKSGQPWFQYLAFNAAHFPLGAPEVDIAKYEEKYFALGWDRMREKRLVRLKKLGLIADTSELPPRTINPANLFNEKTGWANKQTPAWDSLPEDRRHDLARRMAVYAAMIDHMDQAIGRVMTHLKETQQFDNTVIVFLSDNGACAEWDPWGFDVKTGPQNILHTGADLKTVGGPDSYISYGSGWSNASSTPFRYDKHYNHEGGIRTPFIVHWPVGLKAKGIAPGPGYITDFMPTVCELAGATYPKQRDETVIMPEEGISLVSAMNGQPLPARRIFIEHEGNRSVRDGDWKLVALAGKTWELYNIASDPTELHDLAAKEPERVKMLTTAYLEWAARCGVKDRPARGKAKGKTQSKPVIAPEE